MLSNLWSQIIDWIRVNEALLGWMGLFSLVTIVFAMTIIPIILLLLPRRYLLDDRRPAFNLALPLKKLVLVLKNAAGGLFILVGLAMLLLPGQGLLTLFIGVVLIDFPWKRKLIRWFLGRRGFLRLINRFRTRFNRPSLESPLSKNPTASS